MKLFKDQVERLKQAARCLEMIDIKIEILKDEELPPVPRQAAIIRKQIREKSEEYNRLMNLINKDDNRKVDVITHDREDSVTMSEEFYRQ